MWAMLSEIADQVVWFDQKLEPEDWKVMFMAALWKEVRAVPGS
jgi:hypothetical protein